MKVGKQNKYHNRKVVVDGITFASEKEARRYTELKLLEKANKISYLRLQEPFELIPAQYEYYERYSPKTGKRLKDGKRCVERSVVYNADFTYVQNGQRIIEDTKGEKTKDYIIKRKLMLWQHGIRIKEL